MQSQGAIPLTDGTATANCAAYQQTGLSVPLEYYVCALPDTVDAGLSACLFNSLTCCSCHDDSCPLGINVTHDQFNDSVGIVTHGCRVDSTVEGNFVCMVEKNVSTYSAKQYIGTISFKQEMRDSPTLTPWGLGLASGAGGVILTALVLISSFICIVGVHHIRHKKGAVVEVLTEQDEQTQEGEDKQSHMLALLCKLLLCSFGLFICCTTEECIITFYVILALSSSISITIVTYDLLLILHSSISVSLRTHTIHV